MQWMLVVLVGGMTPVQTDLTFGKLSECLAAEEQLRATYSEALQAWEKRNAITFERRRDFMKARDVRARTLDNVGTCIPRAGSDQPNATPRASDQPPSSPTQTAPPAATPPSARP